MKKLVALAMALICVLSLAGCGAASDPGAEETGTPTPSVPFPDDQLYAVACLGYQQPDDLAFYTETYLNSEAPPTHYISAGEYYLVIPRYEGMILRLYKNDLETGGKTLLYEDAACRPFLIQCNVSDIFPDVTISLTWEGETVEFAPHISLMDGSVQVGDRGLDITK